MPKTKYNESKKKEENQNRQAEWRLLLSVGPNPTYKYLGFLRLLSLASASPGLTGPKPGGLRDAWRSRPSARRPETPGIAGSATLRKGENGFLANQKVEGACFDGRRPIITLYSREQLITSLFATVMDPLSITASAVAVIQAAGFTTTTIYSFVQSIRSADSRISSLCDELSSLQSYLDAVQKLLEDCRSRELSPVQPELWQRCDEALKDCLVTLSLLETLVNKIKDKTSNKRKGLRWRARVTVDLSIHGDDLAAFRGKIHKSNSALQMMLHAITVSLSQNTNASQEKILFELEQLKYSFEDALRVSLRPTGHISNRRGEIGGDRVSRNLHKLAAAARHFHTSASSTSGSSRAGSNVPWSLPPSSMNGDVSEHKQQRLEAFVEAEYPPLDPLHSDEAPPAVDPLPQPSSANIVASPAISPTATDNSMGSEKVQTDLDDDEDDEAEDELEYFDGLQDLARDRILNGDYAKAIEFLTKAMKREVGASTGQTEFRGIQIQLALCHFFRRDWKQAEPIVMSLAKVLDEVTCNLLHALSLAHLFQYSLDTALKTCRKAMRGKKQLLSVCPAQDNGPAQNDYAETVALFAMIHHIQGDPIRAEIFHRRLPKEFEYRHPASELDFIVKHPRLLPSVLGDDIPGSLVCSESPARIDSTWESAGAGLSTARVTRRPTVSLRRNPTVANSPLRMRFASFERWEIDTLKIVAEQPSQSSPTDSGIGMDTDDEIQSAVKQVDGGQATDGDTVGEVASAAESPVEKIVVETPHIETPNDDVPPPLKSDLRRRFTRIFANRRPQCQAIDEPLDPKINSCPETTLAPSQGWLKTRIRSGIPKSKALLRKDSDGSVHEAIFAKRARTFRLGNVEFILKKISKGRDLHSLGHDSTWKDASLYSTAQGLHPPSSQGLLKSSVYEYFGLEGRTNAPHGPEDILLPVEIGTRDSMRRPRCPMSQDGTAGYLNVPGPGRSTSPPPSTIEIVTGRYELAEPEGCIFPSRAISRQDSLTSLASRFEMADTGAERSLEREHTQLRPFATIDEWDMFCPWIAPTLFSSIGGGLATNDMEETTESMSISEASADGSPREHETSALSGIETCPVVSKDSIPSRLATALISLSAVPDENKHLIIKSELTALLRDVRFFANDPLLAHDLRRIIATLGSSNPAMLDDPDGSDSGYESETKGQTTGVVGPAGAQQALSTSKDRSAMAIPRDAPPSTAASSQSLPLPVGAKGWSSFIPGGDLEFPWQWSGQATFDDDASNNNKTDSPHPFASPDECSVARQLTLVDSTLYNSHKTPSRSKRVLGPRKTSDGEGMSVQPGLKRAFSFTVGDEAELTLRSPGPSR